VIEHLEDAPIVEALCEIRTDAPPDATFPGALYERIKERFSDKESVRPTVTVGNAVGVTVTQIPPFQAFWN